MLPVLTFASGLIAGIVGVQLLRKAGRPDGTDTAAGPDKVRTGLREAAVSGLTAVETSAASLRAKLTPAGTPAATDGGPAVETAAERERDA